MSIVSLKKAWQQNELKTGEMVTLLALADCHNGKTGQCNPGYEYLTKMTNLSERQVKRIVKRLEDTGLIRVIRTRRKDGLSNSNKYVFQWPNQPSDKSGKSKSDQVTNQVKPSDKSGKYLTQNVTLTGIEPEEGTGNPADTPQGGTKSPNSKTEGKEKFVLVSKDIAFQVYSVWEKGLTKYQTTKPVLLGKEKKQLKDAARQIIELEADPVVVIRKAVVEWDRYKSFVIASGVGFTVAANPDTGQLVRFSRQAVEMFRENEIREAQDKSYRADQAERKAKAEVDNKLRSEQQAKYQKYICDFMLSDDKYRSLTERLAELEAKKSEPDFGMTEADRWIEFFDDETILFAPDQAWKCHKIDIDNELQTYLRESGLADRADEHWREVEGI